MIEWYKKVFRAKIQHENELLAFMTFDEEHHRLVIFEDAATIASRRMPPGSIMSAMGLRVCHN
jgi:hypothetical protein